MAVAGELDAAWAGAAEGPEMSRCVVWLGLSVCGWGWIIREGRCVCVCA